MLVNLNTSNGSTNITEDIRNAMSATAVPVTATPSIVLAANANRTRYMIYNPAGGASVFIREGVAPVTGATPAYNVMIPPNFIWKDDMEDARFPGPIHAVTASGTATIVVSEGALP